MKILFALLFFVVCALGGFFLHIGGETRKHPQKENFLIFQKNFEKISKGKSPIFSSEKISSWGRIASLRVSEEIWNKLDQADRIDLIAGRKDHNFSNIYLLQDIEIEQKIKSSNGDLFFIVHLNIDKARILKLAQLLSEGKNNRAWPFVIVFRNWMDDGYLIEPMEISELDLLKEDLIQETINRGRARREELAEERRKFEEATSKK